jgi:hypothetical protein
MNVRPSHAQHKPGVWIPPGSKPRSCRLELRIADTCYTARFLPRQDGDEADTMTLQLRANDRIIWIARENGRVRCSCPDFSDHSEYGCDHMAALRALRALDALGWSDTPPPTPSQPRGRNRVFGEGLS